MKVFSFFTLFSLALWAMDIPAMSGPRKNFHTISKQFQDYFDHHKVTGDIRALYCRFEDLLLLLASLEITINQLENRLRMNGTRLLSAETGLKKHVEYAEGVWRDTFLRENMTEEAKDEELTTLRDEHQTFLKTIENYKVLILNCEYEIEVSRRHRAIYISALEQMSNILEDVMSGAIFTVEVDDFGLEPGEIVDVPIYPWNPDWESWKVLIMRGIRKPSTIVYSLKMEDAKDVAATFVKKGLSVLVVKYDPEVVQVFDDELPCATYDAYNPIPDSPLKYSILHMKHPDISALCPQRSTTDTERTKDLIPNLKGMRLLRQMICFQFSFALDYDFEVIVVDLGYPAAQFFCSSVYHSIYQHYIKLFSGTELKNLVFANNGTQDQIIIDDEATVEEISTEDTEEF